MKFAVHLGLALISLVTTSAMAELTNISASGQHTTTQSQIACTIAAQVTPTFNGTYIIFAFAEGTTANSNPKMRVESLDFATVVANDDWQSRILINGIDSGLTPSEIDALYSNLLRRPARPQDAAILYFIRPNERVCAFSNEEGGSVTSGGVNMSITDVTRTFLAVATASPNGKSALSIRKLLESTQPNRR
ncbi:MAG: hypothetical protein JNK52_07110 [Zoogloeaceae bacterium]|nr:hypothetical protein [Zoogloeaceae bacterium]